MKGIGHSDISTTMYIYSHVDIEMKKNAAKKINELFANVSYNYYEIVFLEDF